MKETFFGQAIRVRNAADQRTQLLQIGKITFILYLDTGTPQAQQELDKAIDATGVNKDKRKERVVTFAFNKNPSMEKNAYVVYLSGEKGQTATPIGLCSAIGLKILDHFDLLARPGVEDAKLQESIDLIARGIAVLSGVGDDAIKEIAKKIADEGYKLLSSGLLMVKIRPIDTREIKEFHEAEQAVMKSL
jgi:hypothetical protein